MPRQEIQKLKAMQAMEQRIERDKGRTLSKKERKNLQKTAEERYGKKVGKKAHKYLAERGTTHAMSFAIEARKSPARSLACPFLFC